MTTRGLMLTFLFTCPPFAASADRQAISVTAAGMKPLPMAAEKP